ncbi:MAG: outer membrane beta-barrel protein [Geminicoccaceae bacterium]
MLRRKEEERRQRIEQLSRIQPPIAKEGALLASPGIPTGLLPKRGIKSGRIVYLPSVTLSSVFTDNANSSDDDREDDLLLGAAAAVRAQTLLQRHQFGVEASATAGHSTNDTEDDFLDWEVGADGRFDLDRQQALRGAVNASLAQEADSSAEVNAGDDAELNAFGGGFGYLFNGRSLDASLDGFVDREEFSGDNTDDRDNTTYTASANLTRNLSKQLSVFIAPAYAVTEFDEETGSDGQGRDSHEITGLIGAEYRPRPRFRVGGTLGYSETYFDDSDTDDDGSVVGSLTTRFAYDSRTDFELAASRDINVTTVDGSASETTTSVSAGVTRLLAQKHALSTALTYLHTDFDDLNRTDQDLLADVEYFYRLGDNLIFNLGYEYLTRFSDVNSEEFHENRIRIGVTLAY